MPRIARIIAPGYPHHVTQRGNNRADVFFDDEDRQTYLKLLSGYARKHCFQIWAYCLINNHIHLLAVPETDTALARGVGLTKSGLYAISQPQTETVRTGRPFGSESFVNMLEYQLNQKLKPRKAGRPSKKYGECPEWR